MVIDDNKQKRVREAMLEANGISATGFSPEAREKVEQLMDREERRLRLSKKLVMGMWIATVAIPIVLLAMKGLFPSDRLDGWLADLWASLAIAGFVLFWASITVAVK